MSQETTTSVLSLPISMESTARQAYPEMRLGDRPGGRMHVRLLWLILGQKEQFRVHTLEQGRSG